MASLLEVAELRADFGASHILKGVSLTVGRGQVVALLGRNGAGKTTTLRALMGLVRPRSGTLRFRGELITHRPAYWRAQAGMAYVPQDRRIFRALTVEENLDVARRAVAGRDFGVDEQRRRWSVSDLYELFPQLGDRRRQSAGRLSGGEQRMLSIARGLITNPLLILSDEPTDGLAPLVVEQLFSLMEKIAAEGVAILLAEQNIRFAAGLCRRGYIIDRGRTCLEGSLDSLLADEESVGRYLAV